MSTDPETGRRTGAQTRAEILRVALKLFTDKGFEGTSIRDISQALGITKSALYYHFDSKDAILSSLMLERRHDLDELVEWIKAQPVGPDLLRDAALRWIDGTTPQRLEAMRFAHANRPVMQRLTESGGTMRSAFGRVVDLLVSDDAAEQDRLYARMVFDTAAAALLSAQGTDADTADVIAAARRATLALAAAVRPPV